MPKKSNKNVMPKKSNKIVKSSGYIHNFNLQAIVADVEIINLDPDDRRKVKVEIFNWTDNIPVALPVMSFNGPDFTVGDGGPIEIEPNTACGFFARILDNNVFAFEVRITFFDTTEDVVANCQGLRFFENLVGQTIRHVELVDVDLD